jgi:hypothetical protein
MDENMSNEPQSPEAELARLADGSLPEARAAELSEQVGRSPELASALAEQQRALAIVSNAQEPAPDSLHRWLDQQTRPAAQRRRRRPRLRLAFAMPLAAALAAVVVLALVLAGGGSSAPTLQQTSHLALAAAVSPAPSEAPGNPHVLSGSAAGISFPYWDRTLRWKAVGSRVDRLHGRTVMTVFYTAAGGRRVGYAIVSGSPLNVSGGVSSTEDGHKYTLLHYGSARLVTWERDGHTCVIAGRTVSDSMLLRLARQS